MKQSLSMMTDLTTQEQAEVNKILEEIVSEGSSNTYNNLLKEDYTEIPVDIETFLKNPRYLGKGLVDEENTFTVFPILG